MQSRQNGENEIIIEWDIIDIIQLICEAGRKNNLEIEVDEKESNVNIKIHIDNDEEKDKKLNKILDNIKNEMDKIEF